MWLRCVIKKREEWGMKNLNQINLRNSQENNHIVTKSGNKIKPPICPECNQHECGRIPVQLKSKGGKYKLDQVFYPICWWCARYEKNPELLNFDNEQTE